MNQQFIPEPQISIEQMVQAEFTSLIQVKKQQQFVILLMVVSILQASFQLGIAFISVNSDIITMKLSITIPMFIIFLVLQFTCLLFVKTHSHFWNVKIKIFKTRLKEILITILYSLISTTGISIFAVRLVFNSIIISAVFLILFCNVFSFLFTGIVFLCYDQPTIKCIIYNYKETLVSSMTGVLIFFIIYIILQLQGVNCTYEQCINGKFWFVVFMIFMFILFLGFATSQVISLFQLMNGKFKLTESQYYIASLLLFHNSLLPFLD